LSEYKRVVTWSTLLFTVLGSFAISLIVFIPAFAEHSRPEQLANGFTILFYCLFIMIVVCTKLKELSPKINETIILLQTIAIIYWTMNTDTLDFSSWVVDLIILIGFFLGLFALFQAFSYKPYTKTDKLLLSIWSSMVIFLIGFDNANKVLGIGQIENAKNTLHITILTAQYFVLGISSIYICSNLVMVFSLFAGRGKMTTKEYRKGMNELKEMHASRVETRQLKRINAFTVLLFTTAIFTINYYFKLLPANFLIWLVFILFSVIVFFYDKKLYKENEDEGSSGYYRNYKRFR
jgi:hypothetical protein